MPTPLPAALAADFLLGEPPNALHPTVWMGRPLGAARAWNARARPSPAPALLAGALTLAAGALAAGAAGGAAGRALARVPNVSLRAALGGLLLKPAFSVRALLAAGGAVERALRRGDLAGARRLLAWHLVSRDTGGLTASEVAGAAVESLAENLGDGVVAPLMAHAAAGLGGAYAYRFVNTADAVLGYRSAELEWFGKAAARADDLLNLAPARLTAVLIALAAPAGGGSVAGAVAAARADAGRTPSPNAGWPMAAMAGALGVRLDKRGAAGTSVYVLHAAGRAPGVEDLARARRVVAAAAGLAGALAAAFGR